MARFHVTLRGERTPDVNDALDAAGAYDTGASESISGEDGFGVWIDADGPDEARSRVGAAVGDLPVEVDEQVRRVEDG